MSIGSLAVDGQHATMTFRRRLEAHVGGADLPAWGERYQQVAPSYQ